MSNVGTPQSLQPAKPTPVYALVVAGVVLLAYLAMTYVMFWVFSGKDDPHWQSAMTVYNGFQALGTAAAGLLLGTTIQQARVNTAERDAATAKGERDDANAKIEGVRSALSDSGAAGGGAKEDGRLARIRTIVS